MVSFLPDHLVFCMIVLLQDDGILKEDLSILDMHLYLYELFRTDLRTFDFYKNRAEALTIKK